MPIRIIKNKITIFIIVLFVNIFNSFIRIFKQVFFFLHIPNKSDSFNWT